MPSNPTILVSENMTGSGTAWASSTSVSPAANSLVVVLIGSNGNDALSAVSSTFATGGWTVSAVGGTGLSCAALAWAIATGTPGSGTVSATFAANTFAATVQILEIASGFDTSTVIGATATGTFTTENPASVTFSGTPASGSLLIGGCRLRQSSGGSDATLTPSSGWTGLAAHATFNEKSRPFYAAGSNGDSLSVTFSGTNGDPPSSSGVVGIEILAESVSAATLSSPTGTATGQTTATIGCDTDDATGTLYGVVTTSATAPSIADIKAGTGAVFAGTNTSLSVGANTISATGLTAATTYYGHMVQDNGADSNVVSSASFTTDAVLPSITGISPSTVTPSSNLTITLTNGGETQGTGAVTISPTDDVADVNAVTATINTWSDTSIVTTGTAFPTGTAHNDTLYVFVTNDSGETNAAGYAITVNFAPTLSNGAITSRTVDGFTIGFTTNVANGTAYYGVYTSEAAANAATAQDIADESSVLTNAVAAESKTVSAAEAQTFTAVTGLNDDTQYWVRIVHYGTTAS